MFQLPLSSLKDAWDVPVRRFPPITNISTFLHKLQVHKGKKIGFLSRNLHRLLPFPPIFALVYHSFMQEAK